jgi:hypothetical protein
VVEAQDIVHFRPAPAIDRLVVVPDAADVFLFFSLSPCGRGWIPQTSLRSLRKLDCGTK